MGISKAEQSFIKASILNSPPSRADGRKLEEFRPIAIQTQSTGGGDVAPLANGSAKVDLGGSEVIAAIKLEAEDVPSQSGATVMGGEEPLGRDGGRVVCTVSWSVDSLSCLASVFELDCCGSRLSEPKPPLSLSPYNAYSCLIFKCYSIVPSLHYTLTLSFVN